MHWKHDIKLKHDINTDFSVMCDVCCNVVMDTWERGSNVVISDKENSRQRKV